MLGRLLKEKLLKKRKTTKVLEDALGRLPTLG